MITDFPIQNIPKEEKSIKSTPLIRLIKKSVKNGIYEESLRTFLEIKEEINDLDRNEILIPIYRHYLMSLPSIDINIANDLLNYKHLNDDFELPEEISKNLLWLEIDLIIQDKNKSETIKSLIEEFYSENLY